jgi:YD repeat-containing protein
MATRKKKRATRGKAQATHSDSGSDHHATWFAIGRIIRITKTKGRRSRKATKASPKEVKTFLKWVLAQL